MLYMCESDNICILYIYIYCKYVAYYVICLKNEFILYAFFFHMSMLYQLYVILYYTVKVIKIIYCTLHMPYV